VKTQTTTKTKATFGKREEAIAHAISALQDNYNSEVRFWDRHYDIWAYDAKSEERYEVTVSLTR